MKLSVTVVDWAGRSISSHLLLRPFFAACNYDFGYINTFLKMQLVLRCVTPSKIACFS